MNIDPGTAVAIVAFGVPGLLTVGSMIGKLLRGDKDGKAERLADRKAFTDALAADRKATADALSAFGDRLAKIEKELRELLLAVTRSEHLDDSIKSIEKRQSDLDHDIGRLRETLHNDVSKLRERVRIVEEIQGIRERDRATPIYGTPIPASGSMPKKPGE